MFNRVLARYRLTKADVEKIVQQPIKNPDNFDYVEGVCTLRNFTPKCLLFLENYSNDLQEQVNLHANSGCLFVLGDEYASNTIAPAIIIKNPRYVFAILTKIMFNYDHDYWDFLIHSKDKIDSTAKIMPGVVIGRNVTIGQGTIIFPNVVIGPNCTIGSNVIIKPNTVIGFPGYRIFKDNNSLNTHFPHVGGVIIGNNVEIGALNTICSGSIDPTVVHDYVKTDDHVHIAHNCIIGYGVQITAHAEISGSVEVGQNTWIAPNVSIIHGIHIGENAFIGIGSNVIRSVNDNTTVIGNPARPLIK